MSTTRNQSELARLRQHITLEFESAQRGLNGLAQGTAQHQVMTARMNRVGGYRAQLATRTIGEIYTRTMEGETIPVLQEPCL